MGLFQSFDIAASGMKGTYIKVLNDVVFDELNKVKTKGKKNK